MDAHDAPARSRCTAIWASFGQSSCGRSSRRLLAPPLLQPQLAQRRCELGEIQPQGPRAPQLLFGRWQIAACQIHLAEHQSDAGIVGLLLQHLLQFGDGALSIAPLQISLGVLDALLRRRLLAGADGEQAEQET